MRLIVLVAQAAVVASCTAATDRPVAASVAPAAAAAAAAATFEGLACANIEWVPYQDNPKAAIRVPVRISGRDYRFQLDTGANRSFLYGDEAAQRGWAPPEANEAVVSSIEVAGTPVPPARLELLKDREAGSGTIGLDLLLGHYVVLDFPGARFCLVPRTGLPAALAQRISWTRASLRYGKFFVPLSVGERHTQNVFFDTGASLFPLSVDSSLWTELTGKQGKEQAATTIKVPSWGKEIEFAGSPSQAPLQIAGVTVDRPIVYTNTADPTFFRQQIGGGTEGLFGNTPLLKEVVVLDLTPEMRFGILQPKRP